MRKLIHRVKTNKNMIPFRYYYGQLEEKAKKLYREVYEGISHEKTEIKCHYYPGWEKDFVRIHKALCFDNPHLYTWNSQLIRSRCNEKTLFLYITYMDQQWSKRNMGSIMNRILQDSGALHAANNKEALQKLHDHLTKTWQYGYYPPEYMGVYHIVGPLVNQVGVCQGFAFASKGEVGTATKNLVYGTEEVLAAVGVCGVRYIDKLGHYIPIRINEAGVAISITVDEFKQYMSEKHADTDSSDSGAKYYPAMLLSSAKGSDSLFVPLYGKEMNMEEACDYVDATMALSGVFDNYWKFAEQVRFCNVYTTERADAEMLCQKVVECPKNAIVTYGTSNPLNPGESETNAA